MKPEDLEPHPDPEIPEVIEPEGKPEKIRKEIDDSLPSGEEIIQFLPEVHCDGKYYAVALTGNRIVMRKRGFWKNTNEDYPATRITKVSLNQGWFRSAVSFEMKDGEKITFDRLNKDNARMVCGHIRAMISAVEAGPNTVKICPDCGAQVKMNVKVCPYCEFKFKTKTIPPAK